MPLFLLKQIERVMSKSNLVLLGFIYLKIGILIEHILLQQNTIVMLCLFFVLSVDVFVKRD